MGYITKHMVRLLALATLSFTSQSAFATTTVACPDPSTGVRELNHTDGPYDAPGTYDLPAYGDVTGVTCYAFGNDGNLSGQSSNDSFLNFNLGGNVTPSDLGYVTLDKSDSDTHVFPGLITLTQYPLPDDREYGTFTIEATPGYTDLVLESMQGDKTTLSG